MSKVCVEWLTVNLLSHLPDHPARFREISPQLMSELVSSAHLFVMQTEFSVYVLLRLVTFRNRLSWRTYNIQYAPNQINKPGPFVEFYTGPAYSSGLAQTVCLPLLKAASLCVLFESDCCLGYRNKPVPIQQVTACSC